MNDLSKVFIVHKKTRNIYQLDLSKNIQGHVIKKYTKPIALKPKSSIPASSIPASSIPTSSIPTIPTSPIR